MQLEVLTKFEFREVILSPLKFYGEMDHLNQTNKLTSENGLEGCLHISGIQR